MKASNKRSRISILFCVFVAFLLDYATNECNADFLGKSKRSELFPKSLNSRHEKNYFNDISNKNIHCSAPHQHKGITDIKSNTKAKEKFKHMIHFNAKNRFKPALLKNNFLSLLSTIMAPRRLLADSEKGAATLSEEKQKATVAENDLENIFGRSKQNSIDEESATAADNQKKKDEIFVQVSDENKARKTKISKKLTLKMQEDLSKEWQEALTKCHMWLALMQADGRCREALQRLIGDKLYSTVYGLCDVPIVLSHSSIKLLKKAFKEKADVYLRFYPAITMVVEYGGNHLEEEEENLFIPVNKERHENDLKTKNDTKPEIV